MDYDLGRLGSREFEHLTQALCLSALGARINAFGDGPDGGREATTRGHLTWDVYGEPEHVWTGYTVVQAKFRLRLGDVASNAQWLLREVRKELSRWTDARYKRSRTEKPDNLLVVTNVALSAAVGGGIDTVNEEIARLASQHSLELRNWRLWHYDDICVLLDAHESVRVTYGGFVTSGDVLARMTQWAGFQQTDLGAALTMHATKDMLAQQYVRLGQAGDPEDQRLSLGSVAVDLEATVLGPTDVGGRSDAKYVSTAAHIIERGERVHDHSLREGAPRDLLVVGGPGQGKSTLAQMVCQAYRVRLLRESGSLSQQAARLRSRLEEDFAEIGLRLPEHLRWPVRVNLSDYGDQLAATPGLSLLRYLAARISSSGPYTITGRELMSWLGKWPWILVFDGLDEVVFPLIREQVTVGINSFLVDAATANADVLTVVTTRPQGYAGEFGTEDYDRLDLISFRPETALAYAERLTTARFEDDEESRAKVLDRLRRAATAHDSQRLMTSPLQVTIMALLLERRQRTPHDRYQLFDAYFEAIYSREANKPTPVARLLEDRRSDIEAIHETVALELQQQAECQTEHDASMLSSDLRLRALRRLEDEGHNSEEAHGLADALVDAATHRLVLLVPYRLDEIGFEVRSLQEYMAARALTRGTGAAILNQLRPLVPSAHWRNTWLFAAGRLFREREELRDPLISMLSQADNEDLLAWLVRAGAELATDMLADDIAIRSPQYRRLLADQAISRLGGLPDGTWRTLGTILRRLAEDDPLIRQKLDRQISISLSAGGGARAHVILMLSVWTRSTGGFAARARQLQSVHGDRSKVENLGALLWQGESLSNDPRIPRLESAGVLSGYVSPPSSDLNGDDSQSMRRLRQALRGNKLGRGFEGGQESPSSAATFVARREIPSLAVLDEALNRPAVADAFSELVDQVPLSDWHIAAVLREIARYWYSRRIAMTSA